MLRSPLYLFGIHFLLLGKCIGRERMRAFSIFSLVQFPNDECTVQSDTTMKGVCLSLDDCNSQGGTEDGNCASGFGVCCMFSLSACGGTVNRNLTYVSNPGFPSAFTTTGQTCEYIINPSQDSICQIRLDFDDFRISQPAANGACDANERFSPTSPTMANPPMLCGQLTSRHMYIESGSETPAARFTITTNANALNRFWKIKISQIPCESPFKAPVDCVQYHTGVSGQFQSFNFDGTNPPIQNQLYAICFRQEEGFCAMQYRVFDAGNNADQFQVGTGISARRSVNGCMMAHIQLKTLTILQNADNTDQYCGATFNQEGGNVEDGVVTVPFMATVFNDAAQSQAQVTAGGLPAVGFNLMFTQVPCGEAGKNTATFPQ